MARHWADVGFGTPVIMHLFYAVKILLHIPIARLIEFSTGGTRAVSRGDRSRR